MRPAAAILLLAASLLAQEAQPLPEGASLDIVVQELRGEVEVQTAPKTKWIAATQGLKLAPGAKLCTGVGGEAVLLFGTNSVAIVSEVSTFEIRSFGMKGEELVAEAFIDPGVAHVSVKQLEQFQTDFQVSTPRLTCSVRGSAYTIWSNGGAGLLDLMRCNEHLAEVILANLQQWTLAAGLTKDSSNDTPEDTQTRRSTTDVTPQGSPPSEQVARLVAIIAHTLALDPGSLTLGASGSPASGETTRLREFVQEHCGPDEIQRNLATLREAGHDTVATFLETGDGQLLDAAQSKLDDINEGRAEDPTLEQAHRAYLELRLCLAAAQLLEDRSGITTRAEGALLHTTIDNLDAIEHLIRDEPFEGIDGGIEDIKDDMFLFARRNGFPRFMNEVFLPYLDNRFLEDPEGLQASNPALFLARRNDFLDDDTGYSFNDLDEILALADLEAHSPVSERAMSPILIAMVHAAFHISEYAETPGENEGEYDFEHRHFHEEFIDPLDGLRQQGDTDRLLAVYVQGMAEFWEDSTGCEHDDGDPDELCDAPGRHYEDRLVDVLRGYRGATGRFEGFRSQQEHDAMRVLVHFSDVRHHAEAEDLVDFLESHRKREFELTVVELVGLAAAADVFEAREHHDDLHNLLSFLEQQDPQEFGRRHFDYHNPQDFGHDAFLTDWQAVQDQARANALSGETLGHALLDTMHRQFHLQNGGLPSGNLEGQYDFEHDGFHQNVIDPLHATLGIDFSQFTHDVLDMAHQSWHDKTGVPLNPGLQHPGRGAHDHFHESLDQLHGDMHAATRTSDPPQ